MNLFNMLFGHKPAPHKETPRELFDRLQANTCHEESVLTASARLNELMQSAKPKASATH